MAGRSMTKRGEATMTSSDSAAVTTRSGGAGAVVILVARILLAAIFVVSFVRQATDFQLFTHYMTSYHLPAPGILLPLAMILEFVCSVLLILGVGARSAAWVLAAYTLVLALIFHGFWAVGAHQLQAQLNLFLFHLETIGGLLCLAIHGPGRLSVACGRAGGLS